MGITYRQLKTHGESIELERQESIVTETKDNNFITRKKTILRERFLPKEEEKVTTKLSAHKVQLLNELNLQIEGKESKHNLLTVVESASLLLKQLAEDIDNEIYKLKQERDFIMHNNRKSSKVKKNAAIQNNMTWGQNLKPDVEFTVEKFSSQHKFVCTSPRYGRDEQTSCRPRMRTIGLQKNPNRSCNCNDTSTKRSTGVNTKAKLCKESCPVEYCCFDYGNIGDAVPAPVNAYHMQASQNSGCHKVYQRYNMSGNYNGVICNQNSYLESGVSPCNDYNYCRDEFHYDYPNSCYGSVSPNLCCNYLGDGCCNCGRKKSKTKYARCNTDLNTDDFYYGTSNSPRKDIPRSPTRLKYKEGKMTTKKYMLAMADRQKQLEREERAKVQKSDAVASKGKRDSKRDSKKPRVSKQLQEELRDKLRKMSSEKIARLLACADEESEGSDISSSLREYKVKSKEKLLKITLQKQKQRVTSLESDYNSNDVENPGMQYSFETKRAHKKMHITAYKPGKPQSADEDDDARKLKKEKSRKAEAEKEAKKEDETEKGEKYSKYIDEYGQKPELTDSTEREQKEILRRKDQQTPRPKEEDEESLTDVRESKTYSKLGAEPVPAVSAPRSAEELAKQNIQQKREADEQSRDQQRRKELEPIREDSTAATKLIDMKAESIPQNLTRTSTDSSSGKTDYSRANKQKLASPPSDVQRKQERQLEGSPSKKEKTTEEKEKERDVKNHGPGDYDSKPATQQMPMVYPHTTSDDMPKPTTTTDTDGMPYVPRPQRERLPGTDSGTYVPRPQREITVTEKNGASSSTSRSPSPTKFDSEKYRKYPYPPEPCPRPCGTPPSCGSPVPRHRGPPRPYDSVLRLSESPRLGAVEAAKRPSVSPRPCEPPRSPSPYKPPCPCKPRPCGSPCPCGGSPRSKPSTPQYIPCMRRPMRQETAAPVRDGSPCYSTMDYESAYEEVESEFPPYIPQRRVEYRQDICEEETYNFQEQSEYAPRNAYENDEDYNCMTGDEMMYNYYDDDSKLKLAQHWNASTGSRVNCRKCNNNCVCKSRRTQVPDFTGCPCMLETYLNLVSLYCNDEESQPNSRKTINCS